VRDVWVPPRRGHRTPRKNIDIVLVASAIKDHRCGQAGDSSRQSHDIEEQETGVDLAREPPQIVPITTTPGAAKDSILRL